MFLCSIVKLPRSTITQSQKLLCLFYHGFLNKTTTYLKIFIVPLLHYDDRMLFTSFFQGGSIWIIFPAFSTNPRKRLPGRNCAVSSGGSRIINDLKFKALLCLMFSSGLRIGEVRHLKCADIEHSRGRIFIRSSKNRSSRYAQLSEQAWQLILQYWYSFPAQNRPREWLFPQKRGPSKPIDHQRVPDFSAPMKRSWDGRIAKGRMGC